MNRSLLTVILGVMAIICARTGAAAQSYSELVPGRSGTLTFVLDGRSHSVAARAYLSNGRLFINGRWVEDSTVKVGKAGLAATFMLRVKALEGEYVVGDERGGTMLSLHYGGNSPSKMYMILRAGEPGSTGTGRVSIASMNDRHAQGTFEFNASDVNDPSSAKNVTGSFDVEFKRIGEVAGE